MGLPYEEKTEKNFFLRDVLGQFSLQNSQKKDTPKDIAVFATMNAQTVLTSFGCKFAKK